MENILIIDTETDGLSPEKNKVLEIAAVMFNVPSKTIIHQASTLIDADSNDAAHINGISVDALKSVNIFGKTLTLELIFLMCEKVDLIMAHNAQFDKKFVKKLYGDKLNDMRWICSKEDISWPPSESLRLTDIAKSLGVESSGAHRALNDCIILANCLAKLNDLQEQLNSGDKKLFRANVGFEDRELPKKSGFYWNSLLRRWEKKMTEKQASLINFSISPV